MGYTSMLGANDPTGIYLNRLELLSPKISAYEDHRGVLQGKLTPILQQVYTGQYPVAAAILN